MAEDATQGHVHHPAGVVCLRAHVEDCHDRTDEDEPKRAIYASRDSNVDGKADMVERGASGVEKDHDAAETSADERCDDDGLPGEADCVQTRADVVCCWGEGYAELEGEEVPSRPVSASWWSWFEIDVAPTAVCCSVILIVVGFLRL